MSRLWVMGKESGVKSKESGVMHRALRSRRAILLGTQLVDFFTILMTGIILLAFWVFFLAGAAKPTSVTVLGQINSFSTAQDILNILEANTQNIALEPQTLGKAVASALQSQPIKQPLKVDAEQFFTFETPEYRDCLGYLRHFDTIITEWHLPLHHSVYKITLLRCDSEELPPEAFIP
ncbi:hypothetical protein HY642_01765 [Candidatus Woesearchaeota archaeon]|nr:hypothetical protein [Candidatus Woesearchaeota archaeon]